MNASQWLESSPSRGYPKVESQVVQISELSQVAATRVIKTASRLGLQDCFFEGGLVVKIMCS